MTSAPTFETRTIALDLHDLLEDWAITRGLGSEKGLADAVEAGMRAVRGGADLGDAFAIAKNYLIRR